MSFSLNFIEIQNKSGIKITINSVNMYRSLPAKILVIFCWSNLSTYIKYKILRYTSKRLIKKWHKGKYIILLSLSVVASDKAEIKKL